MGGREGGLVPKSRVRRQRGRVGNREGGLCGEGSEAGKEGLEVEVKKGRRVESQEGNIGRLGRRLEDGGKIKRRAGRQGHEAGGWLRGKKIR